MAVVEAGLGGERDATNVFTAQELRVAIFTAIGMEHAAALGALVISPHETSRQQVQALAYRPRHLDNLT